MGSDLERQWQGMFVERAKTWDWTSYRFKFLQIGFGYENFQFTNKFFFWFVLFWKIKNISISAFFFQNLEHCGIQNISLEIFTI